jgi:hypothetical protein
LRALPETEAPTFFGIDMPVDAASGVKSPRRRSRTQSGGSRKQRITRLLAEVEKRLDLDSSKVTLGDFIRLTQLERELEEDEPPREIIVTWKDPAEKRCESK